MLDQLKASTHKSRAHGGLQQFLHSKGERCPSAEIIDFSVNINPYGPAASMQKALKACDISQYPEPSGQKFKAAMSRVYPCPADQGIIVGNGAAELMWTYAFSHIDQGTKVLILEPTFSEFRSACQRRGADIREWRAEESTGFYWDFAAIQAVVDQEKIEHLYVCNPNSPTGSTVCFDELIQCAKARPWLRIILDLAFTSLSPCADEAFRSYPNNILRLFSLTKEHSIPGIRAGFAITDRASIDLMEAHRSSWTVNALAIAAGCQAASDFSFVEQCRERILQDLAYMGSGLKNLGATFHIGAAPMVLIRTGNGLGDQQRLWRHGLLVRDGSSYQLPAWIRVFPRPRKDTDRLLLALKKEFYS